MLKKLIYAAGAAVLLAASSVSFAQPSTGRDMRQDTARRTARHGTTCGMTGATCGTTAADAA